MTKEEIVERIKVLAQDAENAPKDELNSLKQNFYKILNAEKETINQQAEEIADKSAALEVLSQSEQEFKAQMKIIRDKKAVVFAKQEEEKKNNLVLKSEIIEKLKALNENGEECGKHLDEFKALQQQWNETGQIPAEEVTNIWKQYQLERDKFYDNLKINNEMREYDFKKNLEVKTRLCEQAEKLTTAEDVVSAFHQLQDLHQQYRETGSVAKEVREELWSRFKEASTIINRRHQNHFDEISNEVLSTCVSKVKIEQSILSYDRFMDLIRRRIVNDQDKYIFFCLFEGIKGKNYQEIVDLKMEDIDENELMVTLSSGRKVYVPEEFIDICKKADAQTEYYNLPDLEIVRPLIPSNTILKGKSNSRGIDINRTVHNTISRNINYIDDLTDVVTAKSIRDSGMIHYLKRRADKLDITVVELLYDIRNCRDIIDKYQFNIATKKRWILQFKDYLQ